MVDNTKNYYHVAPDKGSSNGPVWSYSGSYDKYISNLRRGTVMRGGFRNKTSTIMTGFNASQKKRRSSSYWLEDLGPPGSRPLAGDGYKYYRNVVIFRITCTWRSTRYTTTGIGTPRTHHRAARTSET
ncbi:hypothetical protein GGS20DRAFT_386670 [Poronia punctata]|nr:hypothetical protein GGS20DRAFT_386670 [Poronia punctata]